MDAGTAPDLFRTITREAIAAFFAYPHLVAGVLSVGLAAFLVASFWTLRGAVAGAKGARIALRTTAIREGRDHRAAILFCVIDGPGGAGLRNQLVELIERDFGEYAFQPDVRVELYPLRLPVDRLKARPDEQRRIFNAAADALSRTDADVVVWGKRTLSGRLELRVLEPPARNQMPRAQRIAMRPNGKEEIERLAQIIAYVCARRARPVLNRPQDYKPEKLQPIVQALNALVDDSPESLNDAARLEVLGDFASGALSLGERGGETGWLVKALDARRQYLDRVDRGEDPGAWGRAQQEVGRALAALGEREADRSKLEEAVGILRASLDALRATESLQAAEIAMRALSRAEQTLQQRKKIGLRWPV